MRGLLVGVVVAGALTLAATSPARAASPCAPPQLGFGIGEGANTAAMPPSLGELRIAMLFVDFADAPATALPAALVDAYVPPVVDWYREASYGKLRVVVEPLRRWLRMPRLLREYEDAHFTGAIEDVLTAADSHYDFGGVDALYLMTSMEAGTLASAVIDHEPRRIDGAEILAWAWFAPGRPEAARPEVLIHETGHLLGLPDLYDVRRPGLGHHHWDIMTGTGGAGLLAWHRWKLGWLSANDILCVGRRRSLTASLAPLARPGGRKAIIYRTRRAAVVVEVRARTAIDASLCKAGVLVYRVDFTRGAPESFGRLGVPIKLWPARRGNSERCGNDWRAPLVLGRGEIARTTAFGVQIRLLARLPDGTYRVRVTS